MFKGEVWSKVRDAVTPRVNEGMKQIPDLPVDRITRMPKSVRRTFRSVIGEQHARITHKGNLL
jgi:hypothetical protein